MKKSVSDGAEEPSGEGNRRKGLAASPSISADAAREAVSLAKSVNNHVSRKSSRKGRSSPKLKLRMEGENKLSEYTRGRGIESPTLELVKKLKKAQNTAENVSFGLLRGTEKKKV